MGTGRGRRPRQSSLSLNRSDCARVTMVHRQRQQQLQVNNFITIHKLITSLNTSDNIVWTTIYVLIMIQILCR